MDVTKTVIPDTDSATVAKLAAVIYLYELGKSNQDLRDITPEDRAKELRDLASLVDDLVKRPKAKAG